jgi:DNA-binding IclR family transcriptional regulator
MSKNEKLIISVLENSNTGLTFAEIVKNVDQPKKKVFKALRKLFEKGKVDCQNRRYKLVDS